MESDQSVVKISGKKKKNKTKTKNFIEKEEKFPPVTAGSASALEFPAWNNGLGICHASQSHKLDPCNKSSELYMNIHIFI